MSSIDKILILPCGLSVCISLKCLYFCTDSGYGSVVPDAQDAESHPSTKALGEKVGDYVEQYIEAMEKVINAILISICSLWFSPQAFLHLVYYK